MSNANRPYKSGIPNSQPFVLRFAAIVFMLGAASVATPAQQPKVLAPHKPVAPRMGRHSEWDKPAVSQSATGGLWMIGANFKASLYLTNGLKTDPLTVAPVLYLSNGVRYTLTPLKLEPSGTAIVDINQELAKQGVAPYATLSGYAEVQYEWASAVLCAGVWNVDAVHSLIFTSGLQPPPADSLTPGASAGQGRHILEGMWWKQEINVTGFLALSNVTGQPIHATVQVTDSGGTDLADHEVTVSPHGTKTVDLLEMLSAPSSSGGVVLTHDGPENGLAVNGGLEDEATGYSAHLPVLPSPGTSPPGAPFPGAPTKTQATTYAVLGLMTGAADPMMNFPAGTVFTPYEVLRNVSNQPFSVTPTLWWMEGGAARSAQLPEFALAPHRTQDLNVPSMLVNAGLKNFNGSVNLLLDTKGDSGGLLMASGSVDRKNTYVFEVRPGGVQESASKAFSRWSTGTGDDTMVTLWNPADEAQDFVFTLFYTGGHYGYPIHLGPRATQTLNVSEILHNTIPDAEGNVVPAGVHEGSAEISGTQGENEHILVSIDAGIYNVQKATCGPPPCGTCNGFDNISFAPSPFAIAMGGNTQLALSMHYNTGNWYDLTNQSTWNSSNTSVATVSTA